MSDAQIHNVSTNPVRRWRVRNHVTQAALAAAVGVHPSVVSQWEQRRAVPGLLIFHRLHRYTGLAVHVLLRFFVPLPAEPMEKSVVVPFRRRS
jgi:transcriptional regulator with XRE-family HTH domain